MPPDLNQLDTDAPMGAEPDSAPMSADISSMPDPQQMDIPNGEVDHEGAMAKADLYKLANYSLKLFKKIQDDDQLEAWVQAKITKAADYIASVYHYLEYEMKFSEYGHKLDNSDVMNEGQKRILKNKLNEAKAKMAELKKAQAEKVKNKTVKEETSSTGGEIDRSKKGVTKHTQNPNRFSDEEHTEPKSQAKSQSAAEKEGNKAADKAEEKEGKNWEKRFGKGSVTRVKDGKKVDEALKGGQKKLDTDNDDDIDAKDLASLRAKKKVKEAASNIPATATTTVPGQRATSADLKKANSSAALGEGTCNHTAKGKKCPVHGLKECGGGMYEAKPSAGLSKAKKSAVVKDAKAGKDIGKPGKGFDELAKKTNKKIAAAAMWKNVKETTAYIAEKAKAEADYDHDGKIESGKDEHAGAVDNAIKASKAKAKETVKESTEISRMRELTGRLNQTERQSLTESGEVASIRALTQRLLG